MASFRTVGGNNKKNFTNTKKTFKDALVKSKNYVQSGGSNAATTLDATPLVMKFENLPIYPRLEQIIQSVLENQVTALESPTSTGKSIGIPRKCAKAALHFSATNGTPAGQILVAQPTKTAVHSSIKLQKKLNDTDSTIITVGYACGGKVEYTKHDSIVYCTAGHARNVMMKTFTRILIDDDYSCQWPFETLMLDEFDSGSIETYLCVLMYCLYAKEMVNPQRKGVGRPLPPLPKLIIASATMDEYILRMLDRKIMSVNYINLSPDFKPSFPVKTVFESQDFGFFSSQHEVYKRAAERAFQYHNQNLNDGGAFIIFVPGKAEIQVTCQELNNIFKPSNNSKSESSPLVLIQAHGDLDEEELSRIYCSVDSDQRKIIVATNAIQRSVTVENVSLVIDSMHHRISMVGDDESLELELTLISKADSIHRRGRTGRTRRGVYHCLISERSFQHLPDTTEPEVYRSDISYQVLKIIDAKINPLVLMEPLKMNHKVLSCMKSLLKLGYLERDGGFEYDQEWWWRGGGDNAVEEDDDYDYFSGSDDSTNSDTTRTTSETINGGDDDDGSSTTTFSKTNSPRTSSSSVASSNDTVQRIIDIKLDTYTLSPMGGFCSQFPLDVRKSAMIWYLHSKIISEFNLDYQVIQACLAIICTIHGFGRGIYHWPVKNKNESAGSYEMRLNEARVEFASKFVGFSDVETLINVWTDLFNDCDFYHNGSLNRFCKQFHLHARRMSDIVSSFKIVSRTFDRITHNANNSRARTIPNKSCDRQLNTFDKAKLSECLFELIKLTHQDRTLSCTTHVKRNGKEIVDISIGSSNGNVINEIDGFMHDYFGQFKPRVVLDKFGIRSFDKDVHLLTGLNVPRKYEAESPLFKMVGGGACFGYALVCLKVNNTSIVSLSHFNPKLLFAYANELVAREERRKIEEEKQRLETERMTAYFESLRVEREKWFEEEEARRAEEENAKWRNGAFNLAAASHMSTIGVDLATSYSTYSHLAPSRRTFSSDIIITVSKRKKKKR